MKDGAKWLAAMERTFHLELLARFLAQNRGISYRDALNRTTKLVALRRREGR